jgi:hypothetical protein
MKFIMPLEVRQSKKKMFKLNMNIFRNSHYRTLSKAKIDFADIFAEKYGQNPGEPLTLCRQEYTIFFPNNRDADVMNIGAVTEKFTSDCLVKYGWIKDDNRRILKGVMFWDGGVDRDNPRAEIMLINLNIKEPDRGNSFGIPWAEGGMD